MIIYEQDQLLGALTGTIKTFVPAGGLRIIDASGSNVTYQIVEEIRTLSVVGCERIEAGLSVDDLTLDELNQVVDYLDVDTEAQTAGGLRRAIERHLEG